MGAEAALPLLPSTHIWGSAPYKNTPFSNQGNPQLSPPLLPKHVAVMRGCLQMCWMLHTDVLAKASGFQLGSSNGDGG